MAKSKDKDKEKDVEEKEKPVDLIKRLNKEYGDNTLISGSAFSTNKPMIIPFSPAIDLAIGGGIPEGSWVVLSGKPKAGKTTSALQFASNCQSKQYGERSVFYLNIEGRLKDINISGVKNLNKSKFTVIGSTESKILSAQDYLTIGENILMSEKGAVLIIDSYGALCHEREVTEQIGYSTRGGGAMLLSQFCRKMSNVVPVKKSIVVGITQKMSNTSGYGSAIAEKGGMAIQYQGDVKISVKSTEEWIEDGKRVGQLVHWISEFSALGAPPGNTCISYLRYGQGIDEIMELVILATEIGLVNKAGAWYNFTFGDVDTKFQGEAKIYHYVKENPTMLKNLREKLNESLGIGQ